MSKAMKQDKAKLNKFAPEIQSSTCIGISLLTCNFSGILDEIYFLDQKLRLYEWEIWRVTPGSVTRFMIYETISRSIF